MIIKILTPHSIDETKKRLELLLKNVTLEYKNEISKLTNQWHGNTNSFHVIAKGQSISGDIILNNTNVEINIKLPWVATMFKGQIKTSIEQRITKCLD